MKKNNTKPANVQTENTAYDLRKSMDAAARFFDRFGVVKLLASSYDEKVRGTIREDIDGRSLGGRIRKLARTSMNDLTVKFACEAVKSDIPASIIAFDSWFAVPQTISRLMKEAKLTVIARLKTNAKQYYEHDGKMINIKSLYTMSKKLRGKSAWKLSVMSNRYAVLAQRFIQKQKSEVERTWKEEMCW